MASDRVYLDANATEPLRPEARAAVIAALDHIGNPSSIHGDGRAARRLLEDARESVAARFGAAPRDVIFTSGGTEANVLAIHGLAGSGPILRGATEHPAVIAAAGADATILPVDADGLIDLSDLAARLAAIKPRLVCLMLANNETGTLQPIAEAAALCRAAGALLHVDAVQAAGRVAVDLVSLGADSLAISAHKLGGPTGAGALLLAPEAAARLVPLLVGGGQERGRRGGTPALANIAGFAAAALAAQPENALALAGMRDAIEAAAIDAGGRVIGGGAPRMPSTTCIALAGVRSESQVIALDLAGFSVSAGAACSSGKVARSHVLEAMGLGTLAGEAIRVSLPWNATPDHVTTFAAAYRVMAQQMRRKAA
jgi:cysteine desulfurase